MPNISKLAGKLTPSMTFAIIAKAKKMMEEGKEVIGFGAGEPDFDTPKFIADAGVAAIREGKTKYTPSFGIDILRKEIVKKLKKDNGLDYNYDQIILSNGAKHSLSTAFQALCDPGDEVIIPSPYWVSYPEMVTIAGGKAIIIKTLEENNFKITAEQFKDSITDRTKALILNSPSNPTGSVYSEKELKDIATVAVEEDVFVVADEIYEKLIYDDIEHISIASLGEDIKSLTILVNGMSKTYAMTGWRLGYAAAEPEIIKAMGAIQGHSISHPSSIAQYAGAAALKGDQSLVAEMVREYSERREYTVKRLDSIGDITYIKPEGAFYVYIGLKKLLGKSYRGQTIDSSLVFAQLLLENEYVAVVPGIAFGDDTCIRMSYAASMEQIEKGLDKMEGFISEIR